MKMFSELRELLERTGCAVRVNELSFIDVHFWFSFAGIVEIPGALGGVSPAELWNYRP